MADAAVAGQAVAMRLTHVRTAIERQRSFVFGNEGEPAADAPPLGVEVARDLVLRALSTLADAVNYRIMLRLADDDLSIDELSDHLDLGRVGVWDRVSDLVQAGLAGRSLEQDLAGLTPFGQEFVRFVEDAAAAAQSSTDPAA